MNATDQAKAFLHQLSPHIKQREAARLMRDLISENDRLRELLSRALVVIERADVRTCLEVEIRKALGETQPSISDKASKVKSSFVAITRPTP